MNAVARNGIGLGEARFLLVLTLRFSAAFEVLSPQDVGVFSSYSEPAALFLNTQVKEFVSLST